MSTSSLLRFKVDGLDCQNEVRALRAVVGPLVGGGDKLSFNTQTGVMDVQSASASTIDVVQRAVATTGMQAHLLGTSAHELAPAVVFRVEGLDCKNEVAALARELGPLVGEDNLAFDTAQGMMTVAPQNGAGVGAIEEAVARTGMRAELWSPPAVSSSVAEPAGESDGAACGCGAEVQEALSPPLPTRLPGQVVFRIHGIGS